MLMSISHGDQILWPVYITIGSLDAKTWRSQKQPETLLLGSILIIHYWSGDANNKDKDLKANIYYMALKNIFWRTYPSLSSKEMRC